MFQTMLSTASDTGSSYVSKTPRNSNISWVVTPRACPGDWPQNVTRSGGVRKVSWIARSASTACLLYHLFGKILTFSTEEWRKAVQTIGATSQTGVHQFPAFIPFDRKPRDAPCQIKTIGSGFFALNESKSTPIHSIFQRTTETYNRPPCNY